jgi:hypothetical protein
VIDLTQEQYSRLYKEVLLATLKVTVTKKRELHPTQRDQAREATQRDQAREATQRAFERCFRLRPAELDSLDALRLYLVRAARGLVNHSNRDQDVRSQYEAAAAIERVAMGTHVNPSAEVVRLEYVRAHRARDRAARVLKELRATLAAQGATLALGTIDCIARGKERPAEQAAILACSVEEIYAARKLRKRALVKILASRKREDDEESM